MSIADDLALVRSLRPTVHLDHTATGRCVTLTAEQWAACQRIAADCERLQSQLPDGMKNCTILFKECEKGHGWLTATNWIQHGCPTCECDALRSQLAAPATDARALATPDRERWAPTLDRYLSADEVDPSGEVELYR